jgi:ABC-type multidrug transport system ATPase subunit
MEQAVASLDPLARREFLQDLMEAVAEQGLSVVLSSHLVADLERVCDYLIVLVASRVRVAGHATPANLRQSPPETALPPLWPEFSSQILRKLGRKPVLVATLRTGSLGESRRGDNGRQQ